MTTAGVQRTSSLALISATLVCAPSTFASIVYDNTAEATDLNRVVLAQNGTELGDEIFLAGTDRTINDFRFEYFLSSNASGNEQAQVTFHLNDGDTLSPNRKLPNTEIFTSPISELGKMFTGRNSLVVSAFTETLPAATKSFTWSVKFTGIEAGEEVGLVLNGPPLVGASYSDYWQFDNGSWKTVLIDGGATDGSFAAQITAVPEPSTLALGTIGAFAFLGYLSRKRSA